MKVTVLNGSPRKENAAAMVEGFCEGARVFGEESVTGGKSVGFRDSAKASR